MSDPFGGMRQQQEQMRRQQEQMRKQQEQMRKQQEDARKRQMMGAYYEQQKQQGTVAPVADQFTEVERQAAELRQQRATGQLSEAEFKARLNDLMIQDASGTWWMVGVKGGEWYRSKGNKWVRSSPAKPPGLKSAASSAFPRAEPQRHRLAALVVLPVGILLTLGIAYLAAGFIGSILGAGGQWWGAYLIFFALLILGLIITVRRVGKLWSGD